MLVQSKDGQRCLLGKTKRRHRGNMYSCLAGFVEQCESVEDAVRRECWEESGVEIGDVQIVGSQAWPIGAAGHSELMLGCIAFAVTESVEVDQTEMEDVRWFSKSEVRAAFEGLSSAADEDAIVLPGQFAIAHHLIKAWVDQEATESPVVATPAVAATPFGIREFVGGTALGSFATLVALLTSKL